MGTRADFYVGRGPSAEWLGSIAFDGYPGGHPESLLFLTDEAEYRAQVKKIIKGESGSGTTPDQGWPWPWEDSGTTDYAYAFDEGRVWGTCFGHGWWPAGQEPDDNDEPKIADFPNMKSVQNVTMGPRSGLIVVSLQNNEPE
jgi:hypothetical protein